MRFTGTSSPAVRLVSAAAALCAVALVCACGASTEPDAAPRTVTATVTAPVESTAATDGPVASTNPRSNSDADDVDDGSPGADEPATAAAEPCGPRDLSRTTIDAAIAKIQPDALGPWGPTASNFSTCNDISYVVLENGGGMAASDDQLLIFGKQGNFLGTGIRCITSRQNVQSAGPDFIRVDYSADRWITTPSGEQTKPVYPVTFRWNGSRVVMEGSLPYEITRGKC